MKKCSRCKEVKSFDLFHRHKYSSDGYCSKCKECRKTEYTKVIENQNIPELPSGCILISTLPGYECFTAYCISNKCVLYSCNIPSSGGINKLGYAGKWRERKMRLGKHGYLYCNVLETGKTKVAKMHKLIALAFIPNHENKPQINHINGIKSDNRIENLEWVTGKENVNHAWDIGLNKKTFGVDHWNTTTTKEQVLKAYEMRQQGFSYKDISLHLGIGKSAVQYAIQVRAERERQNVCKRSHQFSE